MKGFQSLREWLNESKKKNDLYGCVMMEPRDTKGWKQMHLDGIDEGDIYEKPGDDSYGLEEQPHVTIVYGIHEDEVDPSVVADMMEQKLKPITVKIREIDVFENDEYDVVKFNVPVTKQLKAYRQMFLDSFENTQSFKEYNPHVTIAYVKKGMGKKYKKNLQEPFILRLDRAVYSYHKNDSEDLVRKTVSLEKK